MQERESFAAEAFPILRQTPAPVQPCDGPLHDPAFRQDRKAFGLIGPLDDRDLETAAHPSHASLEGRALITTVGIKLEQKGMKAEQGRHHPYAAVTVLYVARMQEGVKQQALGIYKDVALLALDLLAGVITRRVDRRPPFQRS